jgi:GMP synthase (glutamine-hydrolysing)
MEQIVILDFGSQFTQVIARRIRECRVYSTILRYDPGLHPRRAGAQGADSLRRAFQRL